MTMRFLTLPRLVARLVSSPRCQFRLAIGTCALATLITGQAQAQLIEGWQGAGSGGVVGTAATIPLEGNTGYQVAVDDASAAVYVGPGGVTSPAAVPSVLGPGPVHQHGPYVQQPYANGPFIQDQPLYQPSGIPIECPCDIGCDVECYASVEALYFRREHDERFTFSEGGRIEPFDYELGGRVTIGRLWDCVNGHEFSYAGPFEWERERVRPGAGLQSSLVPVGVTAASLTAFNNATLHAQVYRARMQSAELSHRCWAWDIFSTMIGIRAIDYREDYDFFSQSGAGDGIYHDETRNIMIGPQVGGEYMTPLGLRGLWGFKGKAALLANFNRNEVLLQNAGTTILDAVDSDVDGAGMVEIGTYIKYSITPSIRLTAGYELWYITEVATVASQDLNLVTPATGGKVFADDEVVVHGASVGTQILF